MQSKTLQLIVGLGNPGPEYEKTRHNAGAWFVENIAKQFHAPLRRESKFSGLYTSVPFDGYACHLLIPTTFMNLSGQAVKAVAQFYKILPQNILVAHDEIDLPVDDIRLKFAGGHGGHNGLRDIIQHLGTNQFFRLRIGIGHPGNSKEVHDYVLSRPSQAERKIIDNNMQKAEELLPQMIEGKFEKVMQLLNTKIAHNPNGN